MDLFVCGFTKKELEKIDEIRKRKMQEDRCLKENVDLSGSINKKEEWWPVDPSKNC